MDLLSRSQQTSQSSEPWVANIRRPTSVLVIECALTSKTARMCVCVRACKYILLEKFSQEGVYKVFHFKLLPVTWANESERQMKGGGPQEGSVTQRWLPVMAGWPLTSARGSRVRDKPSGMMKWRTQTPKTLNKPAKVFSCFKSTNLIQPNVLDLTTRTCEKQTLKSWT